MWDKERWGMEINPTFSGLWIESQGWRLGTLMHTILFPLSCKPGRDKSLVVASQTGPDILS